MRRAALFAVLAVAAGCDEDLLNPMAARQPRVSSYGESEFYSDGLAMRELPEGAVPRERVLANVSMATGKQPGAQPNDANYVSTFPIKVDRALLELGQRRYNVTCATCHGPVGDGDSIVARQMALRPPPSLHNYADRPVGYIFEVATHGFGMMASYAAELPVRERWAVVAYIRALQISQASGLDKAPADERVRMEREPQ